MGQAAQGVVFQLAVLFIADQVAVGVVLRVAIPDLTGKLKAGDTISVEFTPRCSMDWIA
ncbi:hypothetical protein [Pseudomonas sp. NPDC089569]|uniref:hypothetical protein n=1 Tax=Pseudomonas sp. NPDC089569 TaxID=3390722 RepID=UPI003CFD5C3F